MVERLTDGTRVAALQRLGAWRYDDTADAIERELRFSSFSEAFAFMTRVTLLAEQADHHPTWTNTYDKVSIRLSTHDAGGLSHKDIALAEAIDRLAPPETLELD